MPQDLISQFIPEEFPLFTQSNGPDFVAFIEAYYQFLEAVGNAENVAFNLPKFRDIDYTPDEFLNHFQYEFLANLPANIAANPRLLVKYATDLYQSKGTKRGFALLFRVLFNQDIKLYIPGTDIFKTSDNQWVQPAYIEVTDSPYLASLVGEPIYGLNSGATALVESYNVVTSNQKVINVLYLSNINGSFLFGDSVMSGAVPYPTSQAPVITGSLSAASIINGGVFWNVGDIVNIKSSTGTTGGLARVASTTAQNGKVIFNLLNGGFGFTMNAVVQVTGGGGSGASFAVGSLVNEQVYSVNIDVVNNYINTQLDISSSGFQLNHAAQTGTFNVGENIIATSANSSQLDFSYITSNNMTILESLANTGLNLSVEIVRLEPNILTVVGTNANLVQLNANVILTSNVTSSVIKINSNMTGIQQNSCNGTITLSNSSMIQINNPNNYILPTANVVGQTTAAHANVTSVTRLTNWGFPAFTTTNMDTPLNVLLQYTPLTIGTIASLTNQNPGSLYSTNPTVTVQEPMIYQLGIQDNSGGIWGGDANVSANSIYANGIATALQIISSGYGFSSGDILYGTSANNTSSIEATAIISLNGVSPGYWTSDKSMLSAHKYLQDSYYYQNYSYEIGVQKDLSTYANVVTNVMGPVGYQLFGKYWLPDSQVAQSNLLYTSSNQINGSGTVIYSGT